MGSIHAIVSDGTVVTDVEVSLYPYCLSNLSALAVLMVGCLLYYNLVLLYIDLNVAYKNSAGI